MLSNFSLLESELMEHKKILDAFSALPVCLKKHIRKFHKSYRPIIPCHQCDKQYYQMCCFHKWVPWCQHHHAFPILEEGLFYLQER